MPSPPRSGRGRGKITQKVVEDIGAEAPRTSAGGTQLESFSLCSGRPPRRGPPPVVRDAYQYYRDGMVAQTSGDYSAALQAYAEFLKLEEDPIDRSFTFYNLGIILGANGEFEKAFTVMADIVVVSLPLTQQEKRRH